MDTEVHTELEKLNNELSKQNSRKRIFWNGVINGLGRSIGATLTLALTLAIFGYIIRTSDAQWVQSFIEWLNLDSYFD